MDLCHIDLLCHDSKSRYYDGWFWILTLLSNKFWILYGRSLGFIVHQKGLWAFKGYVRAHIFVPTNGFGTTTPIFISVEVSFSVEVSLDWSLIERSKFIGPVIDFSVMFIIYLHPQVQILTA